MNGVQEQSSAGGATSVTTPSDREIVTERVFDAPRERVYAAFTDPELIPEWWGPRKTTTTVDVMDVRPGGAWRFVCANPDGSEDGFRGTYREVSAPERVVQTFEWEGNAGPRDRGDGDLRGPGRPDQGHDDLALSHHRGARRDAGLGHGGWAQRVT